MDAFSLSVLYGTSLRLRQSYSLRYRDFKIGNRGLETTDMHLASRFVTALFLTAALAASAFEEAGDRRWRLLRLMPYCQ